MRYVSREEMRELESEAIHSSGIPVLVLMENAGRGASDYLCECLQSENMTARKVLIFCGCGNNGGDGLVAARLLYSRGFEVTVYLNCGEPQLSEAAQVQLQWIRKMKLLVLDRTTVSEELAMMIQSSDVLIDGLFGTGLNRAMDDGTLALVRMINQSGKKVLSLDLPSGMDADTGDVLPEAVHASWTAAFGFPKKAFLSDKAALYAGKWKVIDIGLPENISPESGS